MWLDQCTALIRRDFLTDIRYPLSFVFGIVDIAIGLLSFAFLAGVFGDHRPDGYAPLPFLLIGVALTGSVTAALVCLAQGIRTAQDAGTLKTLLGLPLSSSRLMLMSMLYPLIRAALDFLVLMIVAACLGVQFTRMNVSAVLVIFVLAIASACVIGLASAAFALVFKRGDPVVWTITTATWLLSGVLYPTSVLPPWLRAAAYCVPTTHALDAMRAAAIDGASWTMMRSDLFALTGFVVIGVPAGLWLFTAAVNYARRAGTLGHT